LSVDLSDNEIRQAAETARERASQRDGSGIGDVLTHNALAMTTMSVVRRIARNHLLPHAAVVAFAISVNLAVGGLGSAVPVLVKELMEQVFDAKNAEFLPLICIAIVGLQGLVALGTYGSNVAMSFLGQRMVADVQRGLFGRLVESDLAWVQKTHSGRFISTFMTDVIRMRDATSQTIINLTRHLAKLIGLVAVMFYLDWIMATIATVIIPVAALFLRNLGKRTRKATGLSLEETGSLSTLISETLHGIRVVKAYSQEKHETDRATVTIERVLGHQMESIRAKAMASPVTEALTGLGIAGVLFYSGSQVISGSMTSGEFTGFFTALMLAYQPLKALANQQVVLQEGVAAAVRVFPQLDVEAKIVDLPNAAKLRVSDGAIKLDRVSFRYDDGTKALDNVSIDVPAGQTVALVGPSGAGKSTILNLVPRFYDVSSGTVSIDGQDLTSVTLGSLRDASALVTQEPFLFDDTIRANIAYGSPDATLEEIEAAARNAAAHDFILQLSHGYDTHVGESGLKLSGGQRQRIAIARAMLKNAPILLLDEATSSLDTASELQVQKALQKLMQGRTTLVIAHRLSTIMHADNIYVIDHGRVIEQGRHGDLIAQGGVYAELSRSQFDRADDAAPALAGE
jgi:ATP-binding cassette, subfamily B, bacterial MsbA